MAFKLRPIVFRAEYIFHKDLFFLTLSQIHEFFFRFNMSESSECCMFSNLIIPRDLEKKGLY